MEIEDQTSEKYPIRYPSQMPVLKASNNHPQKSVIDSFDGIMCGIAICFKILAILLYFFPSQSYSVLRMATNQYIAAFILTIIFTALDFWVTKNLTGRKLIGLNWWSQYNDQQEQWVFESCSKNRTINTINVRTFWISIIVFGGFWVLMTAFSIVFFQMFWIVLAVFCGGLTAVNIISFFKCPGDHQETLRIYGGKIGIRFFPEEIEEKRQEQQKTAQS